jgi:hypothetical protein
VLTVLSIAASAELNKLFNMGIDAVHKEREKMEQITEQNKDIQQKLEGLEPQY